MALRKDHELCQSCRLDSVMLTSFELLSGVHCKAKPKEPPPSAPLDAPEPPCPQPPVEPTAPPSPEVWWSPNGIPSWRPRPSRSPSPRWSPRPNGSPRPNPNPSWSRSPSRRPSTGVSLGARVEGSGMFPLQEVIGPNGPTKIRVPFKMQDLNKMKAEMGSFTEDPDRWLEGWYKITGMSELTWKDVVFFLNTTLTHGEKQMVSQHANYYANALHRQDEGHPIAEAAIPIKEPSWNCNTPEGRKSRDHMLACLLAGLRAASKARPKNFNKLLMIEQGPQENPAAFLERLKEGLDKYMDLDPDSAVGNAILGDRLLTQATPDIRRKLQKSGLGLSTPFTDIIEAASIVHFIKDQENEE
uniref:Core shell protein Gag P30 domain-containing protein n=1 Tax=Oryctolagus cuniculus TaxID=9986 RepID=A0A5F9C971_RABIT